MQFDNDVKYHTPKGNNTPRVITNPMNIFTYRIKLKFTIETTLTSNASSSRTHSTHDPTNFSKRLRLFYHEILPTSLVDFSVPLYIFACRIRYSTH